VTAAQDGGGAIDIWYKHSFKEAFMLKARGARKMGAAFTQITP
jgi:hypothetical protein